jgi:hypothetical protein
VRIGAIAGSGAPSQKQARPMTNLGRRTEPQQARLSVAGTVVEQIGEQQAPRPSDFGQLIERVFAVSPAPLQAPLARTRKRQAPRPLNSGQQFECVLAV